MRAFAAIAVIAAVAAVGWASAAGAPKHAEWTATLLVSRSLDIGPRGPGIGDALIRKWRLTDRDGNPVGFGYENCHWMSSRLLRCAATYRPPNGTIDVAGIVGAGEPLAITGGTGQYLGERGQATWNGRTLRFEFAP